MVFFGFLEDQFWLITLVSIVAVGVSTYLIKTLGFFDVSKDTEEYKDAHKNDLIDENKKKEVN